ncbi:hypothetical protein COCON_G00098790 [Conger conger]|uniref:Myc target protein 1 homolog n=1 Tax=Conger conger TaxID=82655 RepID=A0A9Q1HZV0_CONCO|nr:hypothetical protein COCON_G00098790 [Conger conger]
MMADNDTISIEDILKEFDTGRLILAFSLSMVVGLLLGSLIYVVMTWMSRRRASASITRRPPRHSRGSARGLLHGRSFNRGSGGGGAGVGGFDRRSNNSLVAFGFQRQASLDLADPPGRKNSFRASTFHPLVQCSHIAREAEEGGQGSLPRTPPTANANANANAGSTPPRPDSFWSNSSLRGFHASQTPPPAYESVIRAFQETCT